MRTPGKTQELSAMPSLSCCSRESQTVFT